MITLFILNCPSVYLAKKIEYLTHLISREGVKVDLRKIEVIVDWPKLNTITKLSDFLRLTGYYKNFMNLYIQEMLAIIEAIKV